MLRRGEEDDAYGLNKMAKERLSANKVKNKKSRYQPKANIVNEPEAENGKNSQFTIKSSIRAKFANKMDNLTKI